MACSVWLFLDFPKDASSPTRRMHGQSVVASSPQCVSKAAVKSGRHSVSVTCPRGTLFSVDLNTNRGAFAKSKVKMLHKLARRNKVEQKVPTLILHGFGQDVRHPNKVFTTEIGGLFEGHSIASSTRRTLSLRFCSIDPEATAASSDWRSWERWDSKHRLQYTLVFPEVRAPKK